MVYQDPYDSEALLLTTPSPLQCPHSGSPSTRATGRQDWLACGGTMLQIMLQTADTIERSAAEGSGPHRVRIVGTTARALINDSSGSRAAATTDPSEDQGTVDRNLGPRWEAAHPTDPCS